MPASMLDIMCTMLHVVRDVLSRRSIGYLQFLDAPSTTRSVSVTDALHSWMRPSPDLRHVRLSPITRETDLALSEPVGL